MSSPTYTVLTLNGRARHFLVSMCDDCGALVHSRTVHDAWHRTMRELMAALTDVLERW